MALVIPERGQEAETAKRLLDLADDVAHVDTTSDGPGVIAFVVPDYLAERFDTGNGPARQEADPPVKRGRPRKITSASVDKE